MKFVYSEIIRLEKEYAEMTKMQFIDEFDEVTRANLKYELGKRCVSLRDIANDVSKLLSENVYPYLKDPALITPEIAKELEEFAEILSGYTLRIDTGLSYEIRDALTKYSRIINDDEMYITNLFFKGLNLLFLNKALFLNEMSECYEEIIYFCHRYETFSKPTRNIIVRAFGNSYISTHVSNINTFFERTDRALSFWKNTAEKIDPDFNWNSIYSNIDENTCTFCASYIRSDYATEENIKFIVPRFCESAKKMYLEHSFDDNNGLTTSDRYKYYYLMSKYHNGDIELREYTDSLYDIYMSADRNSYSINDSFKMLQISSLYIYNLAQISDSELSIAKKQEKLDAIEDELYKYVFNIPTDATQNNITMWLSNFTTVMYSMYDSFEFLRVVLNLTIFRHKPTFVHSLMVAKISGLIMRFAVKKHPEEFVGVRGFNDIESVEANNKLLENFTWYAGLAHDIGKISYTNMLSIYVRKLNDYEFKIIKQHPISVLSDKFTLDDYMSRGIFKESDSNVAPKPSNNYEEQLRGNTEVMDTIAKIAYGHHKSYDEKSGYPLEWSNENAGVKKFTDIITIADCIDAATDDVGRSYALGKTLEIVLDELDKEKGTRYSPFIVDLIINNKELYDQIQDALENFRYDMYYECFNLKTLTTERFEPNI